MAPSRQNGQSYNVKHLRQYLRVPNVSLLLFVNFFRWFFLAVFVGATCGGCVENCALDGFAAIGLFSRLVVLVQVFFHLFEEPHVLGYLIKLFIIWHSYLLLGDRVVGEMAEEIAQI